MIPHFFEKNLDKITDGSWSAEEVKHEEVNLKNLETIIIFPYNECNLACRMCPVKKPVKVEKAFSADLEEFNTHLDEDQIAWISSFSPRAFTILGGEPLISPLTPYLLEKLQGDSKITEKNNRNIDRYLDMLNRNIVLYTNGLLINSDTIETLLTVERISVVVSMEGDRDYTDHMRGRGVFDRAMNAVESLMEANIPVSIRVGYSQENLQSVYRLIRRVGDAVPMEFSPRIDKPPLSRRQMRDFYYVVASLKSADILQPSYKNFVGFDRRCPAGIKRFTVHSDGSITACQWGSEVIAMAGDDDDFLRDSMERWALRNTRIEIECVGCRKATVCFSSCRVSRDYKQCPAKDTELSRAVIENLFDAPVEVSKKSTMRAIKSMRNISMAGC